MASSTMSQSRRIVSLILKAIVVVAASVGVYLSANAGVVAFMGGGRVFMYFTIQSNIAVALACAAGAVLILCKARVHNAWFVLRFILTVSITLTGAVFTFVLAPTLGDMAWNLQNVLTHLVVPIAAIADFFVIGLYGDVKKRHVPFALLPPLAYVIYAGVAFAAGWEFSAGKNYPYFFLNWGSPAGVFGFCGELPFMGCMWWILAGSVVIYGLGLLYVLLVNLQKRRR